jgi:hypothetical protein
VLAAIWEILHGGLLPPPPRSIGIMELAGFRDLISCFQSVRGKILSPNELAAVIAFLKL